MTSEAAVARLVERLETEGVPYMFTGALSANLYGVPRATNDADLVVAFEDFDVVAFARGLGPDFVLDRQAMIEGFTGTMRHVVQFVPKQFDIELFHLGNDPHDRQRFSRRRRQRLPECDREAWVATAEDVLIQKLRWGRRKDLDDIVNLLTVSGDMLDWEYVGTWTREHGTGALLADLRAEADGAGPAPSA